MPTNQKSQEFEIYLSDLKDASRDRLLTFLAIKESKEGNYDVFPIAVILRSVLQKRVRK